jgi:hypothetical protein
VVTTAPTSARVGLRKLDALWSARLALLLALFAFVLYLPLRQQRLYHEDSVGFAKAIHSFNLAAHQPQAPGYPLYVATLRVVEHAVGFSDNDTLVLVSLVSIVAAVLLFFLLARSWLGELQAVLLAAILMTSPVVWFNAEIAMSYAVGLVESIGLALLAWQARQRAGLWLWLLPAAWGLAAGFRPEAAAMLAPVVVYAVWPSVRHSPKFAPFLLLIAMASVALWFLPLIHTSGGLVSYLRILNGRSLSSSILPWLLKRNWPVFQKVATENSVVAIAYLLLGCIGILPLLVYRLLQCQRGEKSLAPTSLVLLWFLPGFFLDVVTVVGHAGYVLPYLPPLLLLLWPRGRPRYTMVLAGVGIALQIVYFLVTPQMPGLYASSWMRDTLLRSVSVEPTRSRLIHDDALTTSLVNEVRAHYPADQTLLVVPVGDEVPRSAPIRAMYAQAQYYLPQWNVRILYTHRQPEFDADNFPPDVTAAVFGSTFTLQFTRVISPPPGHPIRWLVWFCDTTSTAYPFDASWQRYELPSGITMVVADLSQSHGSDLTWGPFEFRAGSAVGVPNS